MKRAFTLAEVLITLAIIGVVAAMTMPTLITKHQEKVTVTRLKKVYSTLEQAYLQAVNEYGDPTYWDLIAQGNGSGAVNLLNHFKPYLKITKNCEAGPGCWFNGNLKALDGTKSYNWNAETNSAKAILNDGTGIYFYVLSPTCTYNASSTNPIYSQLCGFVNVDINGFKGPNQLGIDTFCFFILKDRVLPGGGNGAKLYAFDGMCKKTKTGDAENGQGCAAWVIFNENMDYLHCNDLAWNGKTKCD